MFTVAHMVSVYRRSVNVQSSNSRLLSGMLGAEDTRWVVTELPIGGCSFDCKYVHEHGSEATCVPIVIVVLYSIALARSINLAQ